MMSRWGSRAYAAILVGLLSGCSDSAGTSGEPLQSVPETPVPETKTQTAAPAASTLPPPLVAVVSYPLAFFVDYLAGESVQLVFPIGSNVDPANWQPDASEVAAYQEADLILLNGAGYAQWIDLYSLPANTLRDTGAGISEHHIFDRDRIVHSHGPEGEHSHDRLASFTWLDLTLARTQAAAVAAELSQLRPDLGPVVSLRFEALAAELSLLDSQLMAAAAKLADTEVIYSRPNYQYFARRYQLPGESLDWSTDAVLNSALAHQLEHLETSGQKEASGQSRLMVWPRQPDPTMTAALAERGIEVLVISTLEQQPESGDFLSVLRMNIEALKSAAQALHSAS